MQRSKGVTIYGVIIIVFGMYTLMGVSSYGQFALMFKGLPYYVTAAVYGFTALYGICGVYCGTGIMKLENWARRIMVVMASVSVVSGLMLNRIVVSNFKELLISRKTDFPPDLVGMACNYAVIMTAAVTCFELSLVYFFTRQAVKRQFR